MSVNDSYRMKESNEMGDEWRDLRRQKRLKNREKDRRKQERLDFEDHPPRRIKDNYDDIEVD